jgi:predicted transcriptional regulator
MTTTDESSTADTSEPKSLQVRIDGALGDRLDSFCAEYTVGKSAVVERALRAYLDEAEKRLANLP